jgi:hypothetical protein
VKQASALSLLAAAVACGPAGASLSPAGEDATPGIVSGAPAGSLAAPGSGSGGPDPPGSATGPSSPLSVRVTSVARLGPGILEVRLVIRNGGAAPARLPPASGAAGGPGGGLAAALLEDAAGRFRTAVLRNNRGEPLCSEGTEEIPAGAEREAWLRFAVDARDASGLLVHVPGLPPAPLPGATGG